MSGRKGEGDVEGRREEGGGKGKEEGRRRGRGGESPVFRPPDLATLGKGNCKCIVNVLEMCFPGATVLLCMLHMEDNVKRKLTDSRASKEQTHGIMRDIFGDTGIAKLRDDDEFDSKVIQLRQKYCTFQ